MNRFFAVRACAVIALSALAACTSTAQPPEVTGQSSAALNDFVPTEGTYHVTSGHQHSSSPLCSVFFGPLVVSGASSSGYVLSIPAFPDSDSECNLNGHSAVCGPHAGSWSVDFHADGLDAVVSGHFASGTQWVSETSFKMHDQGSFSCVGTDCAAVADPDCNLNGVRTYSL